MSRATRHADGTLRWVVEGRLGDNEYALTRRAGFKWHKGKKAWVAPHTPEREAFLLERVSHIERLDTTPFVGFRNPDRSPLPEVQDFRLHDGKLILFLKLGEAYFTRRVNLHVSGAGLDTYMPDGSAIISRGGRTTTTRLTRAGQPGTLTYTTYVRPFLVKADPPLMEELAAQVWSVMNALQTAAPAPYFTPDSQEGVQPASAELLSNAAD